MIKTSIEKLSYDIGFDVGHSDDIAQSNLLNGLSRGMILGCGGRLETQLCYVYEKLTPEAKQIIIEFAQFINDDKGITL